MEDTLFNFEIVDLSELKTGGNSGGDTLAKEVPPGGGCGGHFGICDGDGGCGGSFGFC